MRKLRRSPVMRTRLPRVPGQARNRPVTLTVREMSARMPTVMPMDFKTATLAQDGA